MFGSLMRLGLVRQACSAASRVQMVQPQVPRSFSVLTNNRRLGHGIQETDEEFDQRYIDYLNRPDIDGWEIRKAMADLQGADLVPEPPVLIAAFHACRRVNDLALAIRILEATKVKCHKNVGIIWPYIMQEVGPTLKELGIPSLEECGYDKPELWLPPVFD